MPGLLDLKFSLQNKMNYVSLEGQQPQSKCRNTCFYLTSTIVALCMIAITIFLALLQKSLLAISTFTTVSLNGLTADQFNEMILCIQTLLKKVCSNQDVD
jgi:hypothetical protein